jgi:hypothetical protein
MKSYALAPHVHACVDGDWLIFLDLKSNRYFAAGAAQSAAIAGIATAREACGKVDHSSLERLAERGVLTASDRQPAIQKLAGRSGRIKAPALLQFAFAAHWASTVVQRGNLWRAARQIRSWKSVCSQNVAAAPEAVTRFNEMRPWLPKAYVCLFDALCLLRFLLSRGTHGAFVIGVRARPFLAHCWVELDGAIVDDGGEDCASMREILRL